FEAAVAGAIPIVRPVRESLAGDHVRRVLGIVNGTTNYVLDQMATTGMDLEEAVKEAQALGYAEADPTADVEGYDAAAKAAILASLAFHTRVSLDDVAREGILSVTADDVAWAAQTGHVIKLLAIAELRDGAAGVPAGVSVRVHPALVPTAHPHRVLGGKGRQESTYAELAILPASAAVTRYQVRLDVEDRPGVLAQVAHALAEHGVSIEAVRQPTAPGGAGAAEPGVAELV